LTPPAKRFIWPRGCCLSNANFYGLFAGAAERFAARTAVEIQRRDSVESYTYAELRSLAGRIAGFLRGRGVAPGDRVAILAENDAHWCAAYFGALRVGGVAVPLDTSYKPAQIAALIRDCSPRVFLTSPKYLAAIQEAVGSSGSSPEIALLHGSAPGVSSSQELFSSAEDAQPTFAAAEADRALLLYTSGTTSDPKGVVLTHGNLRVEMNGAFAVIPVTDRDAILGVLPLFHALAQLANLLLPLAIGARVIFLETLNTSELLRALRERDATIFCCVPQFFYLIHQRVTQEMSAAGRLRRIAFHALLRTNGRLRDVFGLNIGPVVFRRVHDVLGRHMRVLLTGGSRFDPAVNRDLFCLGFPMLQAYGLTECTGAATLTPLDGRYTDSVGPPLPGVEIKIAPAESSAEEGARDGEILVRGPIVMEGYFQRPEANAQALAGGWLHTGDLGYLNARGELYITGRSKDVIILSSGKNIYPEEIEAHYLQSPYIKELCVMGRARPGEPSAERLHAVVVPDFEVLRERKVLNAREVLRYEIEGLSIRLPSHKRILSYDVWTEELPRTSTRKLKRFVIAQRAREQAAAGGEIASTQGGAGERSAAELAWAERPEVARALDVIRAVSKSAAAVRPDANIELDLGLDSMERVELLTQLEQQLGADVPEEAAHRIYTVRELVEACLTHGRGAAEGGAAASDGNAWATLLRPEGESDAEAAELERLLRPRPVFTVAAFVVMKLLYAFAWVVFRFRVSGRENLPQQGPCMLCPNHQSYIDPFFLVSALPYRLFRMVFYVGASEYFASRLGKWFAEQIHLVPVDPDTNLLRAMQSGAFGLRHGKVLVLFPEGERSIDGEMKRFKKGAAILSLHLGVPIVPVALDGIYEIWPRGSRPRWRTLLPGKEGRVTMRFGAPLTAEEALPAQTSGLSGESRYAAATERLREIVLEMWRGLRGAQSA
jgi:long-chain acyl-CoA synthetase